MVEQTLGQTDLKLAMLTHHDFRSNVDWVPPGYTSFSGHVKLKIVSIYVCVHIHYLTKVFYQMKPALQRRHILYQGRFLGAKKTPGHTFSCGQVGTKKNFFNVF